MRCKICGQQPKDDCDWNQGRCPHLPKSNFFDYFFDKHRQPNPKWHRRISFLKSTLRIAAGLSLIVLAFWPAGVLFIAAEILGILEELV